MQDPIKLWVNYDTTSEKIEELDKELCAFVLDNKREFELEREVDGAKGAKGAEGAEGSKGDKGVGGAKEAKGAEGDKGVGGAKGAEGVGGAKGAKGFKAVEVVPTNELDRLEVNIKVKCKGDRTEEAFTYQRRNKLLKFTLETLRDLRIRGVEMGDPSVGEGEGPSAKRGSNAKGGGTRKLEPR